MKTSKAKKTYKRQLSAQAIERMRQGGRNRAKQFTSEYQSRAGKLGYKATLKTHPELAGGFAADWRREHPTDLEQKVMEWLEAQSVMARREVLVEGYYVDFLLPDKLVLEVYGKVWHTDNQFHGRRAEEYDHRRNHKLAQAGYTVIILPEEDITSGKAKALLDNIVQDLDSW